MKRLLLAALLLACSKSGDAQPPPKSDDVVGTLAVDIRQTVQVTITKSGDVTLAFDDSDFQLLAPSAKLQAKGTIERFPEASLTMYTASFAAPARSTSVCGARPISLHLALTRRGENARVGGGLTAYCGEGVTSGIPARVFRLSGDLPLP